jgi:hypothetical protein
MMVSPNDLAISGTSGRAKRVTRSVRCIAWLGAVTVPKPMEGAAFRKSVSCRAGDRAGISGWHATRAVLEGVVTERPNLASALFRPCRSARCLDGADGRHAG